MAGVTKRSDTSLADWPALRVAEWTDTRDTLHMWTQIVGKLRLADAPMINHWWQVVLYVSATAPTHPGGAPNVGDWVMVEGYSHELSSCGFRPGGGDEGVFYAYAHPQPDGFRDHPIRPDAGYYSSEAAADHDGWDRDAPEDNPRAASQSTVT